MKLLLDTHIVVWLMSDAERLGELELQAIHAPDAELFISAVTVLEIRAKWLAAHRSNRTWPIPPAAVLEFARINGVSMVPLTPGTCASELSSQPDHGDPFDEMLLAQAAAVEGRLVTRDRQLREHPLAYQP